MSAQHASTSTSGSTTSSEEDLRLLSVRKAHYGPNTSLIFNLHINRGEGTYLYTPEGVRYLDCVNNVSHLGHGHPEVAQAVGQQLLTLNTNSRYLHSALTTYTQELLATLPPALQVLYLVCSGSEANELALRVARAARPGATHVAVMGGAYHGHTSSLIDISPYKFWGSGGDGRQPHVHVIPCPDPYRGEFLDGRAAAQAVVAQARAAGGRIAAFITESVLSCGGQVVLPPGYLQDVCEVMREEGAVVIADEVQCGFGRVGEAFWGFQLYDGVVPDIVTMGKPMGNGFPVSGVVMTRELADAFNNGMEYFNTFGGSTAASVAALTVLRCIKRDQLQEHAQQVGSYLKAKLLQLQRDFPQVLGDVRGCGFMLGMECVWHPRTKQHAPGLAAWVKGRAKARGVLISTDGPYDNVLKLKPPMVFGVQEADMLVAALRCILHEELTPEVRTSLAAAEQEVWARTYGPRMQHYLHNAAELGLLPQGTTPAPVVEGQQLQQLSEQQPQQQLPELPLPLPWQQPHPCGWQDALQPLTLWAAAGRAGSGANVAAHRTGGDGNAARGQGYSVQARSRL